MPAPASVAVIFTPAITAPFGSVAVPVSLARAACWPNTLAGKQARNRTRAEKERSNAGVINFPFEPKLGWYAVLTNAASNLLVNLGYYLFRSIRVSRLSDN